MEITRVICEVGKEPIYVKEFLSDEQVAKMEKQQRISEINQRMSEIQTLLQVDDWRVTRCAEASLAGKAFPEDIDALNESRQALRDEHSLLKSELIELGAI